MERNTLERLRALVEQARNLPDLPAGFVSELTDLVQAERTRQLSEQRYGDLVEAASDAIVMCDIWGRMLFRNSAYYTGLGYSPDEPLNDDYFSSIHPEDQPRIREDIRRMLGPGHLPITNEYRALHRKGHWVYRQARTAVLLDEHGTPEAMLSVIRDITDDRRTQEELRKARDEAQASSRAKGEFLAKMSHEIRTPIHGILGLVELLRGTRLDEQQRDYLQELHDSTSALLGLINDTLDLSKIEAGKADLVGVAFSPERLVREALKTISLKCKDKGLDLSLHLDDRLPPLVLGDPVRVRQVLINLLINAAKFTHEGSISVVVRRMSDPSAAQVRLRFEVQDTGIGIPSAHHERIFESFHQVEDSRTRNYGGTGLGLAIARQLTLLMDGQLIVQSAEGEGSLFSFELPFDLPPPDLPVPRSAPLSIGPLSGTVLVAEDNPLNLRVVKRYLTNLGLHVVEAHDGQEVLDLIVRNEVQLVLMDVRMPTLDGLEATRRLRSMEPSGAPRLPIIALTADAVKGDRERCLEAGMDDYLNKPFTREELERLLWRYLGPQPAS